MASTDDRCRTDLQVASGRPCSILPSSHLNDDVHKAYEYQRFLYNFNSLLKRRSTFFCNYYIFSNSPLRKSYCSLCKETTDLLDKSEGWIEDVDIHRVNAYRAFRGFKSG